MLGISKIYVGQSEQRSRADFQRLWSVCDSSTYSEASTLTSIFILEQPVCLRSFIRSQPDGNTSTRICRTPCIPIFSRLSCHRSEFSPGVSEGAMLPVLWLPDIENLAKVDAISFEQCSRLHILYILTAISLSSQQISVH
jgi:hypothetical protein